MKEKNVWIYQETLSLSMGEMSGKYNENVCEVGIVLEGEGIHKVLGKEIPCKEGNIFVVGPNVFHEYFSQNAEQPLVIHRLCFELRGWLEEPYNNQRDIQYCYGAFRENKDIGWAVLTQRTKRIVMGLCSDIQDGWKTGKPVGERR